MKLIISLFILILHCQNVICQACGEYTLKYVGEFKADSVKIQSVKLPGIAVLEGILKLKSKNAQIKVDVVNDKFEALSTSLLTSNTYEADELKRIYSDKNSSLTIRVTLIKDSKPKEITREIPWDNLTLTKIEDRGIVSIFQLDLGKIIIQ